MNKLRSWLIRKLGGTEKCLPVAAFKEVPILAPQRAEIKTLVAMAYVDLKSTADENTEFDYVKTQLVKALADGIVQAELVTISEVGIDACQRKYLAEVQIVVPNKNDIWKEKKSNVHQEVY